MNVENRREEDMRVEGVRGGGKRVKVETQRSIKCDYH